MKDSQTNLVGISVVRNEADILRESLEYALQFHDRIYAVDCGSEDDTSRILAELARQHPSIWFLGTIKPSHPESVRWQIYSRFRRWHSLQDWWTFVDADEFFHDDPRVSVRKACAEGADYIMVQHIEFYYKRFEYQRWLEGYETLADRTKPIADRRRWFAIGSDLHTRFFRNVHRLRWDPDAYIPKGLVKPAMFRPIVRHYKYRDGDQLYFRIKSRNQWNRDSNLMRNVPHWSKTDIVECLSPDNDPHLHYWMPGSELPRKDSYPNQSGLKITVKFILSVAGATLRRQRAPQLFV